jgi:hypothetical protein
MHNLIQYLSTDILHFIVGLPVAILSFTTIALTTDRNHIIGNPLSLSSSQTIFIQIVGIWTIASLTMVPLGVIGSLEKATSSDGNSEVSLHCMEVRTNSNSEF